jgi:beta-glucosidase
MPFVKNGDLETIAAPTDFLGINFYSRGIIRDESIPDAENEPVELKASEDVTDMGWEVAPNSLTTLLVDLRDEYGPKTIYITENGAAYPTAPNEDGRICDEKRTAYFDSHIRAVAAAIEQGVQVDGYFAWSLLDNFEWAFGYEKRFGLVWVDYETLERTPKDSAHFYRQVIKEGLAPEELR